MTAAILGMAAIIIILASVILMMRSQINSINRQLDMRISEKSRRPVSISLHGADMKERAVKINRSLKEEEQLRLKSVREEKRFKEMIANISHYFK